MTKGSAPFERFRTATDWTPLLGSWIYPLRTFGERPADPNAYLEVIEVAEVLETDVAITRGGGMFVRNCEQYQTIEQRYELVELFNLLLCEFAFIGIYCEPMTFSDVQDGRLIGRYAGIFGGHGNYAHKTFGPVTLIEVVQDGDPSKTWPPNYYWLPADPGAPKHVRGLSHALKLRAVSDSLPALVLAAASHYDRGNNAEAILSSWIASEQILTFLWDKYLDEVPALKLDRRTANIVRDADQSRKASLVDHRTYSASVRAEVLLTVGILPPNTYALLQGARKLRNDLAHRAKIAPKLPLTAFQAMSAMMALIGVPRLGSWSHRGGGGAQPRQALEPEFPFRCGPSAVE